MGYRSVHWLIVAVVLLMAGCGNSTEPVFQGWIEADLIFVAPDEAGRVTTLPVREGDVISAGQTLFTVDDDLQQADLKQSEAALNNARQAFLRAEKLLKTSSGSQMIFDNSEALLREAEARLNASETRLKRRKVASTVKGTAQRVYYRPGEMVAAGRPVISILPPENVKVRFYVAQTLLPRVSQGQMITLQCDGCAPQQARITFISNSAEFTPPVIYSLEERAKLVFLVEARPEHPDILRVGQPVSVVLSGAGEAK